MKVLVVDDDMGIRESLKFILKDSHDIIEAENGVDAIQMVRDGAPDLVMLDILMPDMDGLQVLREIKAVVPDCPVVMLSGVRTIQMVVDAMKLGAEDYLAKPFDVTGLKIVIEKAREKVELKRELRQLRREIEQRYSFGNIIGKSRVMQDVYDTIQLVADKKTTVLITGESGTGKELIAKAVHFHSDRKGKPLVTVNCAAIPETLIESEMFGHEKGAFTDAYQAKTGQFELAHGGTILLDEVGELTALTQAKLLRVLQEREFMRVGGVKKISVDVRVIASTNRDLRKAIEEKTFREDLYYRINVIPIHLPPLREHREDIPLLVEHFLSKHLEQGRELEFGKPALAYLMEYDWPGNIRELENLVERSVVLSAGDTVLPEDLPLHIQENGVIVKIRDHVLSGSLTLDRAVEAFERDLILNAFKRSNLVQIRTAHMLGISRRMLKYKMDKYGIGSKGELEPPGTSPPPHREGKRHEESGNSET